jgi:hypothetical protein
MGWSLTLVDSGPSPTTITLSPLASTTPLKSTKNGQVINVGLFGDLYADTPYQKLYHELSFNKVSSANATTLNSWATLKTVLTYTPDTADSGTPYQVVLLNDSAPMTRLPKGSSENYQGTLLISEV